MVLEQRNVYGAIEVNPLPSPDYHKVQRRDVDWKTPGLKITRLRLVSDPGYPVWDVSYCHGVVNGEPVAVGIPFSQLPKRGMMGFIVEHARREGVYAKGIGILDIGVISKLI